MFLPCKVLLFSALLVLTSQAEVTSSKGTFRAAVYEHAVFLPDEEKIVSRKEALTLMNKNLDVFRQQTFLAKKQGAQLIVFPEDGIYGWLDTRPAQYPYLEDIPDPRNVTWSPCQDPAKFPETEVLYALSCMAKNNSIYLVADMGDQKPCDVSVDQACPSDGRYQYNTAVAFGPGGHLLARSHKVHLWYEDAFNPASPEPIYFDAPFGRVGLFICYDSLFKDSSIDMIIKHNVTTVAYPTSWEDKLPLISSIGYHSSFARGLGINFLASDTNIPDWESYGSGIYTAEGTKSFYYDRFSSAGKLLVADLEIFDAPKIQHLPKAMSHPKESSPLPVRTRSSGFLKSGHEETKEEKKVKRFMLEDIDKADDDFTSLVWGDLFTFKKLRENEGSLNVCQGNVCCNLEYKKENTDDLFAFGVFDGLHTLEGQLYLQYCALLKCADKTNTSTCGSPTFESRTAFHKLEISGQFEAQYIFPQVIVPTVGKNLGLTEPASWHYVNGKLTINPSLKEPILSVSLFGRCYSKDPQ